MLTAPAPRPRSPFWFLQTGTERKICPPLLPSRVSTLFPERARRRRRGRRGRSGRAVALVGGRELADPADLAAVHQATARHAVFARSNRRRLPGCAVSRSPPRHQIFVGFVSGPLSNQLFFRPLRARTRRERARPGRPRSPSSGELVGSHASTRPGVSTVGSPAHHGIAAVAFSSHTKTFGRSQSTAIFSGRSSGHALAQCENLTWWYQAHRTNDGYGTNSWSSVGIFGNVCAFQSSRARSIRSLVDATKFQSMNRCPIAGPPRIRMRLAAVAAI